MILSKPVNFGEIRASILGDFYSYRKKFRLTAFLTIYRQSYDSEFYEEYYAKVCLRFSANICFLFRFDRGKPENRAQSLGFGYFTSIEDRWIKRHSL